MNLLGADHVGIVPGTSIELIACHEPHAEHRWWTALDPRLTYGARPSSE